LELQIVEPIEFNAKAQRRGDAKKNLNRLATLRLRVFALKPVKQKLFIVFR
jgi:hypothetical protein